MNLPVRSNAKPLAPAPAMNGRSPAFAITAIMLREADRDLLAAYRAADSLGDGWLRQAYDARNVHRTDVATELVAKLPKRADLQIALHAIRGALTAGYNEDSTSMLVANLFDAMPHGKESGSMDACQATVLHEIKVEGFPPSVVARARHALIRAHTWLPSPKEILEACEKAAFELRRDEHRLRIGLEGCDRAEAVSRGENVPELAGPPDPPRDPSRAGFV